MARWWGRIRTTFSWGLSPLSPVTWIEISAALFPEDEDRSWRSASARWRPIWWIVLLMAIGAAALLRWDPMPMWLTLPLLLVALGGAVVCFVLIVLLILARADPTHVSVLGVLWSTFALGYWGTAVALRLLTGHP